METANGKVWVHGNATEHIAQDVTALAQKGASPEIVNLASQARLTSLHDAVEQAMQGGVKYNTRMTVNGWQLEFKPPRDPGELPTIIHDRYSGG